MSNQDLPIGDQELSDKKSALNLTFLKVAHTLTFPILDIRFVPDDKLHDSVIEVRMPPKLVELVKQNTLTDRLIVFFAGTPQMGIWTFDMITAIDILTDFGILSDMKTWISNAQDSISKIVSNERAESSKVNTKMPEVIREMLIALKLLDKVQSSVLLNATAKDVIEQGKMDPDTIISRLALAIYHSRVLSGQGIFPAIDDEGELYINFIDSDFYKEKKTNFKRMMDMPPEGRYKTLKIFAAFVAAAYAYYNQIGGG